jgi:HPt (histidine-containing phosphotransfer) domain-containing protein
VERGAIATLAAVHTPAPATPTSQRDGSPVLNYAVLDDIRDMQAPGDDLVSRIVALFRTHAPAALERLAAATRSRDPAAVAETAHAMKSLCRNVGAERLGNLLGDIELAAREGGAACSGEQLATLRTELDAVLLEIDGLPEAARPDADAERKRASA